MKYESVCSHGSFTSWGSGFKYHYEARDCAIDVTSADGYRALARLKPGSQICCDPFSYVETLNKTNQIKALMYSDNTTTNLADTLDDARLSSLIKITGHISYLALYGLHCKNFNHFSTLFCRDFNLKSLIIKRLSSDSQEKSFYLASITTQHNNSVCARSDNLSGLTTLLSNKILSDLIAVEFGLNRDSSAQNLLGAASKLATIGRVLDNNFIPEEKLKRIKKLEKPETINRM